jgi:hypothetical protein
MLLAGVRRALPVRTQNKVTLVSEGHADLPDLPPMPDPLPEGTSPLPARERHDGFESPRGDETIATTTSRRPTSQRSPAAQSSRWTSPARSQITAIASGGATGTERYDGNDGATSYGTYGSNVASPWSEGSVGDDRGYATSARSSQSESLSSEASGMSDAASALSFRGEDAGAGSDARTDGEDRGSPLASRFGAGARSLSRAMTAKPRALLRSLSSNLSRSLSKRRHRSSRGDRGSRDGGRRSWNEEEARQERRRHRQRNSSASTAAALRGMDGRTSFLVASSAALLYEIFARASS